MDLYCAGRQKNILLCDGAKESRDAAEAAVPASRRACIKQMDHLLKQLADSGRLRSPDQFRHERDGVFAVKTRCGLRAYGWLGDFEGKAAFFVSHYILKKQQKLAPEDFERTVRNRAQHLGGCRNGD